MRCMPMRLGLISPEVTAAATSSGDSAPSAPPADRGCNSRMVARMRLDWVVRKSISALGWRPKAMGVSTVRVIWEGEGGG